jgi:protein involved in polysaccharide export with SLBB domain
MPDNTAVYLTGNIVTAVFSGFFYMESSDRSAASAVVSDYPVKIGDAVSVAGSFMLINGERKLVADWVSVP